MRDRGLDRGVSAAGVLLIVFGLIAFVWLFGGSTAPALGQLAPFLVPAFIVGLGAVIIVTAMSGGSRSTSTTPTSGTAGASGSIDASGAPTPVPVVVALDAAQRADVEIAFGAGRLDIGRAAAGHLVDGTIVGGDVIRSGPGRVRLWSDTPWLEWVPGLQRHWTVGVTGEVPVRMEVKAGAADVDIDCRDLCLDELIVKAGASAVRVQAARHGVSRIRTESGAASLDVTVPDGVAARVRTTALLGSREVDLGRFPAVPGGYESPDFAQATDRVDIDARTALGSLRIR
ncbi:MAG TPA: hypothetical protein VIF84_03155 [Candidatus Limnocylindrales bacterium]